MNFSLRPWTLNDIDSLTKYANNYNVSKYLCHIPFPYTKENAQQFIEMAMSKKLANIFCIDVNNEAIGGIGIHPQQGVQYKNAELGYWIAEPFWNNGIITKVILQIVEYGFANFDINRIYASTFGSNMASQKVLIKCGFILEAKFEKTFYKNEVYFDELVFAIRKK